METLQTIIFLIVGFLAAWFKAQDIYNKYLAKIREKAVEYIAEAEEQYQDASKAGSEKMQFAVKGISHFVPWFLKGIFTEEVIQKIVQNTFNEFSNFATMQLNRVIKKDGQ